VRPLAVAGVALLVVVRLAAGREAALRVLLLRALPAAGRARAALPALPLAAGVAGAWAGTGVAGAASGLAPAGVDSAGRTLEEGRGLVAMAREERRGRTGGSGGRTPGGSRGVLDDDL
jgi:hypothetical protein